MTATTSPSLARLPRWSDVLSPHEDIEQGRLEMSTYAADLGGVDRADPNIPRVYRDAGEFFRTTYLTRSLRRTLVDVLGVLSGAAGDRVIQLRTPFGGGKTHTLLALYHVLKHRSDIDPSLLDGVPDPGPAKVVVLSGVDLDPLTPRQTDGLAVRTLWGELAVRLGGPSTYEQVRQHDAEGVPPGGDVLREIIGVRPTLVLLDEVFLYVERAGGERGDHPRRRQALVFLQTMTEVVKALPHAAMVYSLQASTHEAAGDEALLTQLEKLTARVDAKREPVADDELTRVVQRRLFPDFGRRPEHQSVADEVAREYALVYRRVREAYSQTGADRRAAGVEAERFEQRVRDAYPFHPELLDLMYHRWSSLPDYQRTRGALQFLASAVAALWDPSRPRMPLIGPGDVPFDDDRVRSAFFSQVGRRDQFRGVLSVDIAGPEARCRGVDDRVAADAARYRELKVGTRLSTAIMMYSFGARESEEPGVVEADLVQALAAPDLDRNVLVAALGDLRDHLLYLHHLGRRYRFEPKPNLNLMIAEETKKFESPEVVARLRDEIGRLLRPAGEAALLWPADSGAIPDHDPRFRLVYLEPDAADLSDEELDRYVVKLVDECGARRRDYKNALAFAVPSAEALDRCRSAARDVLAMDALTADVRAERVAVPKEQQEELRDRLKAARAELEGAADGLYQRLLVPVAERSSSAPFVLESVDLRAQLTGGRDLHQRLLDALRKHVFDSITPVRLAALLGLGSERRWVSGEDAVAWFFTYLTFPKLLDAGPVRAAVGAGTAGGLGYVPVATVVDGELRAERADLVRIDRPTSPDEIDLADGAYVLEAGYARLLAGSTSEATEGTAPAGPSSTPEPGPAPSPLGGVSKPLAGELTYRLSAVMDAAQFFRVLPALQLLADRARTMRLHLGVEAESDEPFDPAWLRNAVEEHFDEAGVSRDESAAL